MHRLVRQVIFGVALFALATAAPAAPRGLPEQLVPQMLGVNIHFTGPNHSEVGQIAEAGFKFVRMDFAWASVEKTKGAYDFAAYDGLMEALAAKGIRPLFILDYGNPLYDNDLAPHTAGARAAFASFAGAAAAHFKDRGVIWEIWNEPNIGFWKPKPSPDDYVALAKAVSAAIKAADPDATVIGPATSGVDLSFIERCLKLGLLDALDAISVHPYRANCPETAISDYQRLRELIERYAAKGKDVPIVSSEWGYSTVDHPEERQAQYAVRMFLSNLLSDVRLSIWYDWHDDGPDPNEREHHFGTVYLDFKPKPSYAAVQTLTRELDGHKLVGRLGSQGDEYVLLFKGPKGYRLAAWTTGNDREAVLTVDAAKVTVVSMDGKRSEVVPASGKLTLKLSQSPLYVEVGQSQRLAVEEAITFKSDVDTRWRLQDVVAATISNPPARQMKGSVTLTLPGQKPMRKSFSLKPGKSETLKFTPYVLWDGRSSVEANAAIDIEGFDSPILRSVDLRTQHRIGAKAACPMGRILEFRISSPSGYRVKGKLRLFDVKGLKLRETSTRFEVDNQTIVGFTLDEPAPKEFSFGCELIDAVGKPIFRSPVLNYTILEDFSSLASGVPPADYEVVLDGDPNVAAKATAEGDRRDTPYASLPPIPTCKLWYDIDAGRRFFRLAPRKELAMPAKPLEVGVWVWNDGSANTARCRFVDSTGQTFQPAGFAIDWIGWRYRSMPLDGTDCGWWGGAADGKPRPPFKWDTIFLFDTGGNESKGMIFLGPIMLVSEPEQPESKQPVLGMK